LLYHRKRIQFISYLLDKMKTALICFEKSMFVGDDRQGVSSPEKDAVDRWDTVVNREPQFYL
jgi:hypothetical protein